MHSISVFIGKLDIIILLIYIFPSSISFVRPILKINKSKQKTAGLLEVIIYSSPDDKKKNRGFCFLEYESHKAASLAKRRLGTGRTKVSLDKLYPSSYFFKYTFVLNINFTFVFLRFGDVILLSTGLILRKNRTNKPCPKLKFCMFGI